MHSHQCTTDRRMAVKELRAELAARNFPLRGNKRELTRLLNRARAEADIQGSSLDVEKNTTRVEVVVLEESYVSGNLISENMYEDQREKEEEEEDDDEAGAIHDEEEEKRQPRSIDDDDDDVDYDDRVDEAMRAADKFDFVLPETDAVVNVVTALAIARGVLNLGGVPSEDDIKTLKKLVELDGGEDVREQLELLLSDPRVAGPVAELVS